jgi:diaminopimelate decarboxylase
MTHLWHSVTQIENRDGELFIDGCSAEELVNTYGSPLYVYSEQRIRENYRRLQAAFQKVYPKYQVFYAVKANNNPAIVKILAEEGAGMDCSCLEETEIASSIGVPSEKQLFTAVFPTETSIQQAIDRKIILNLENIQDLELITEDNIPEVLSFRVNPGVGSSGQEGLVFAGPNAKFGIQAEDVEHAYTEAKRRGVKRFGVHMMTGSNVNDPQYFAMITELLMDIIGPVVKKLGITLEFINIGGSLGIPYHPDDQELDIEQVAQCVVGALRKKLEEYSIPEPMLIQEPGRYLVADAGILLTTVSSIKRGEIDFLGVDAGMNTLLRPALYDSYHHIVPTTEIGAVNDAPYHIVGQICENTDLFSKDRMLPSSIKAGDHLAFFDVGAYGYGMSSQYNTRPRAAEVLVKNGEVHLIRQRETLKDILTKAIIPEHLTT